MVPLVRLAAPAAVAVLVAVALSGGWGGAQSGPTAAGPPTSVPVEMALTAQEARWRPAERGGRLTLSGVSPRMAVMAAAPRRELAVMPASMLRANWNALFADTGRKTNMVLSVRIRERPVLIPLRAILRTSHVSGERLVFDVGVLRRTAHKPDRLPPRPATFEDPTIVVDPDVTAAIKAMWQALVSFFSGSSFSVPPDPTSTSSDGNTLTYDDGASVPGGEVYKGPSSATMTNAQQWEQVQRQIFDEAGPYRAFESAGGNPLGEITFNGSSYDGLAIFQSPIDYGQIRFEGAPRVVVENSAIFGVSTDAVSFDGAEIGGMNMRGLNAPGFYVQNTLFQTVDVTGGVIGGVSAPEGPRSNVENSAFVDFRSDLRGEGPDGNPDRFNDRPFNMRGIDFESTTFVDSSFAGGADLRDLTFQGCGFQNVDFTGATFTGTDPARNDGRFQPTFDNSIMEGVNFNDAQLQDISFAGVDFGGGRISMDGARLDNVDFTGATGLQFIDWTRVTMEGNVYGLEEFSHLIEGNRDFIRTITFDGQIPEIDAGTGFDIEPDTGYLIDTDTGVRLERDQSSGRLIPIDPATGEQMRDPNTGDPLIFEPGGVFNPETNESFDVDYATGQLEGER